MQTTGRSRLLLCALLAAAVSLPAAPAEPETPYTRLAKLASFLSDGQSSGALEAFDKSMKNYGAIAEELEALAAQTEVLCSIDVIEDKEADNAASDIHHLDLDWFLMLKSRTDSGLVERRRERVSVTMQRVYPKSGKNAQPVWRITALTPEKILAPITIK
jgi:hypothetical protein